MISALNPTAVLVYSEDDSKAPKEGTAVLAEYDPERDSQTLIFVILTNSKRAVWVDNTDLEWLPE